MRLRGDLLLLLLLLLLRLMRLDLVRLQVALSIESQTALLTRKSYPVGGDDLDLSRLLLLLNLEWHSVMI